jgi:hypothetical protein
MWVLHLGGEIEALRAKNGGFERVFLLITVTWPGPTPMAQCCKKKGYGNI